MKRLRSDSVAAEFDDEEEGHASPARSAPEDAGAEITLQDLLPGLAEKLRPAQGDGFPPLDDRSSLWEAAGQVYDYPCMALGELTDNAWDAGATKCEISWETRRPGWQADSPSSQPSSDDESDAVIPYDTLHVRDNGYGMSSEELIYALNVRKSLQKTANRSSHEELIGRKLIGRFGMGFKYGAANLASVMLVISKPKDKARARFVTIGLFGKQLFEESSNLPLLVWDSQTQTWARLSKQLRESYFNRETILNRFSKHAFYSDAQLQSLARALSQQEHGTHIILTQFQDSFKKKLQSWSDVDMVFRSVQSSHHIRTLRDYFSHLYYTGPPVNCANPMSIVINHVLVEFTNASPPLLWEGGPPEVWQSIEIDGEEYGKIRLGWALPSPLCPSAPATQQGLLWYHENRCMVHFHQFAEKGQKRNVQGHQLEALGYGVVGVILEEKLHITHKKVGYDETKDPWPAMKAKVYRMAKKWAKDHRPSDGKDSSWNCQCQNCVMKRQNFSYRFHTNTTDLTLGERAYTVRIELDNTTKISESKYVPETQWEKSYWKDKAAETHTDSTVLNVSPGLKAFKFHRYPCLVEILGTPWKKSIPVSDETTKRKKPGSATSTELSSALVEFQASVIPVDACSLTLRVSWPDPGRLEKPSTAVTQDIIIPLVAPLYTDLVEESVDPPRPTCVAQTIAILLTAKAKQTFMKLRDGNDSQIRDLTVERRNSGQGEKIALEERLSVRDGKICICLRLPASSATTDTMVISLNNPGKANLSISIPRIHEPSLLAFDKEPPQKVRNGDDVPYQVSLRCSHGHRASAKATQRVDVSVCDSAGVPLLEPGRTGKPGEESRVLIRLPMDRRQKSIRAVLHFTVKGFKPCDCEIDVVASDRRYMVVLRGFTQGHSLVAGSGIDLALFTLYSETNKMLPLSEVNPTFVWSPQGIRGAKVERNDGKVPTRAGRWHFTIEYHSQQGAEKLATFLDEEQCETIQVEVVPGDVATWECNPETLLLDQLPASLQLTGRDEHENVVPLSPQICKKIETQARFHGRRLSFKRCAADPKGVVTFYELSAVLPPEGLEPEDQRISLCSSLPEATLSVSCARGTLHHITAREIAALTKQLAEAKRILQEMPPGLAARRALAFHSPKPPQLSRLLRVVDVIQLDHPALAEAMGIWLARDLSRYLVPDEAARVAAFPLLKRFDEGSSIARLDLASKPALQEATHWWRLVYDDPPHQRGLFKIDNSRLQQHGLDPTAVRHFLDDLWHNVLVFFSDEDEQRWIDKCKSRADVLKHTRRLCLDPPLLNTGAIFNVPRKTQPEVKHRPACRDTSNLVRAAMEKEQQEAKVAELVKQLETAKSQR